MEAHAQQAALAGELLLADGDLAVVGRLALRGRGAQQGEQG